MTDPISEARLADLRRIATGEDWSPAQPEDVADLIAEIDRLRADRAQFIAAILRRKHELRIPLDAWYAYATVLEMARGTKLGLRDDGMRPRDEPQPDAERFGAGSADAETPEGATGPQGLAEGFKRDSDGLPAVCPKCHGSGNKSPIADCDECDGSGFARRDSESVEFEYGYQLMRPGQSPMMIGRTPADILAVMRQQSATFPEAVYALRRRMVGPWITVEDEDQLAALTDLSGELDAFTPQQAAELKRVHGDSIGYRAVMSGLAAPPVDWAKVAGHAAIAPEDEGIATPDVHAQIAADTRAYCPDCGHPETNCACG